MQFFNNCRIYYCLYLSVLLKIDAVESRSGLEIYVPDILEDVTDCYTNLSASIQRSDDFKIAVSNFREHSIALDIIYFLKIDNI